MSKFESKEVTYAALHYPLFVPGGIGQIGPTLTSIKNPNTKSVKMVLESGFVTVEVTGPQKQTETLLVPITSFTHMVLAKA